MLCPVFLQKSILLQKYFLLIKLKPFLTGSINFLAGEIIFVWESLRRVYFTFYRPFISRQQKIKVKRDEKWKWPGEIKGQREKRWKVKVTRSMWKVFVSPFVYHIFHPLYRPAKEKAKTKYICLLCCRSILLLFCGRICRGSKDMIPLLCWTSSSPVHTFTVYKQTKLKTQAKYQILHSRLVPRRIFFFLNFSS